MKDIEKDPQGSWRKTQGLRHPGEKRQCSKEGEVSSYAQHCRQITDDETEDLPIGPHNAEDVSDTERSSFGKGMNSNSGFKKYYKVKKMERVNLENSFEKLYIYLYQRVLFVYLFFFSPSGRNNVY